MAFARGRIILISVLLGALLATGCSGAAQRGDPASGDFPESTAEGTLDDFTPSPPPPDVPSEGYPFVPTPAIYRLSDQLNILYLKAHYKRWIDAWIPIPNLAKAANLPGIQYIDQPAYPEED